MGVTGHELVVNAGGDVRESEPTSLGPEGGVEQHLEQEITEFFFKVVVGVIDTGVVGSTGVEHIERLEHLMGLLQQVRPQRSVGLGPVPRTRLPQGGDQLGESSHLRSHPEAQRRDPQRGQVIGFHPVEFVPHHVTDLLVGSSEA